MVMLGVLALQGAFAEHISVIEALGVAVTQVKLPQHLKGLNGLIIPGGESTTIGKLLVDYRLLDVLKEQAREGLPVWGTCAGMILLARDIAEETALSEQPTIGVMDIRVRRNGFGRQVDSFESPVSIPALGERPFPAVFIRAPFIDAVREGVMVLGRLDEGRIVAAQQDKLLVTAFHPELTRDYRFHEYFLKVVRGEAPSAREV